MHLASAISFCSNAVRVLIKDVGDELRSTPNDVELQQSFYSCLTLAEKIFLEVVGHILDDNVLLNIFILRVTVYLFGGNDNHGN